MRWPQSRRGTNGDIAILEAEPTGLGDQWDDEQEGKAGDRNDLPGVAQATQWRVVVWLKGETEGVGRRAGGGQTNTWMGDVLKQGSERWPNRHVPTGALPGPTCSFGQR